MRLEVLKTLFIEQDIKKICITHNTIVDALVVTSVEFDTQKRTVMYLNATAVHHKRINNTQAIRSFLLDF